MRDLVSHTPTESGTGAPVRRYDTVAIARFAANVKRYVFVFDHVSEVKDGNQ
jgi:hypothetical protein